VGLGISKISSEALHGYAYRPSELGARIAPSTYYEHRDRPPTAREVRDADLKPKVAQAYAENYGVYGARNRPTPRTTASTVRGTSG